MDYQEVDQTTLTYTETGMTTGELYKWRIVAVNVVGNSIETPELDVYAAVKPETPLTPTSSSADQTSITIDWIAPYNGGSGLTEHIIYWN